MAHLLRVAEDAARRAGLKFNPGKCATLHLSGKAARRSALQTQFGLREGPLKTLGAGDAYEYLGIPIGLDVDQTPLDSVESMVNDANKIDESLLAPWQKIDELRTFIMPWLEFILRGGLVKRAPLAFLDKTVKKLVKKWMCLPQRASAEVVFLPSW